MHATMCTACCFWSYRDAPDLDSGNGISRSVNTYQLTHFHLTIVVHQNRVCVSIQTTYTIQAITSFPGPLQLISTHDGRASFGWPHQSPSSMCAGRGGAGSHLTVRWKSCCLQIQLACKHENWSSKSTYPMRIYSVEITLLVIMIMYMQISLVTWKQYSYV